MTVASVYDSACTKCAISSSCKTRCLPGNGNVQPLLLVVVDNPNGVDDQAGSLTLSEHLWAAIELAGFRRDQVYVTSAVKCHSHVSDDTYLVNCVEYLINEIAELKPKAILAMGHKPAGVLLQDLSITSVADHRGKAKKQDYDIGTGAPLTVQVAVTLSYDLLISAPDKFKQPITNDLSILKSSIDLLSVVESYRWLYEPKQLVAWTDLMIEWYRSGKLRYGALGCDIESTDLIKGEGGSPNPYSPKTNIGTIQFSWDAGKAVIIPVVRKGSKFNTLEGIKVLIECLRRILSEIPIVGQNFKTDATAIWKKLGVETEHFAFDTMLAYRCLVNGTNIKTDLESMAVRLLGVEPYEDVFKVVLKSLPEEERRYPNVDDKTLMIYGCKDADYSLRLYPILRRMLEQWTYEKYEMEVFYPNMWEMYKARILFPWKAINKLERHGTVLDQSKFGEVAEELKGKMDAAVAAVHNTVFHQRWLTMNRIPNKKRSKPVKEKRKVLRCSLCGAVTFDLAAQVCTDCKCSKLVKAVRTVDTGAFTIDETQPEWIEKPLSLSSPQQKAAFIYQQPFMCMPVPKDGISTDKASLIWLKEYCTANGLNEHKAALDAMSDFNSASKLYSSYAISLPDYIYNPKPSDVTTEDVTAPYESRVEVGAIHAQYFQDGTKSGRLSSRDPSLHTAPKGSSIKAMFVSRFKDGFIISSDYSQAEVRGFVVETSDPDLKQAFQNGVDPHTLMASKAYHIEFGSVTKKQRDNAKSIVFGILFGRGAVAIAEQTKQPVDEMKDLIKSFFASAPKVKSYIDSQHAFVRKHKCVISRFGRFRDCAADLMSRETEYHALNVSVNHPIQGLAGDLCIDSMARITYRLEREGLQSLVVGTVHDSIIIDVHPAEILQVYKILKQEQFELLPTYFPFINVPFEIEIDIGLNWRDVVSWDVTDSGMTLDGLVQNVISTIGCMRKHRNVSMRNVKHYVTKEGKPAILVEVGL